MKQWGFTLVEILVTLAVGSTIAVGALLTFQQIFVDTGRSNSQVLVLGDVHRAALQIKKDIQAHQSANLTDLPPGQATFSWTDQTGFEPENERSHSSNYTISDNKLIRTYDDIATILGRNIQSLSFTDNGTYINFVLTANSTSFPPRTETLSSSIYKRAEEIE